MKNLIVNSLMKFVTNNKELDDVKKDELKFGFASMYTTYSKLLVLTLIAWILGMFKEYLTFLLIYNLIRTFSFGLHATKSWMCWIASTIIFIGIPYLATIITIPKYIKIIFGAYLIIRFAMNAPADTIKRPIINKKRRLFFKYVSTILSFIYIVLSIVINNSFVSNVLFLATLTQSIIISPLTYKIFKLPFNNYKNYITE